MTVHATLATIATAADFLLWNEGREGKREYVHGRGVETMVTMSRNHARLATRLGFSLGTRLDLDRFDVGSADFGVRTGAGIRFPDVYVEAAGGDGRALATESPLLVAEILSPSSVAVDFGEKAEEYTSVSSLLHYLVLSQDEPRLWLWERSAERAFARPVMIAGAKESVSLTGLGLAIPLAELYRGVA